MEAEFFYIVKVNLIRYMQGDEINYISEEKEFKDANPIVAREEALSYYNSYIDTLLEPNLSHNEVKVLLSPRIESADKPYDFDNIPEDEEIYIPPSWDNGIGIFLKLKNAGAATNRMSNIRLIHGIGFGIFGSPVSIMDGLNEEIDLYNTNSYDKRDNEVSIRFYNYEDDEIYDEVVLKTPYDWTGMDTPHKEEEKSGEESKGNEHRNLSNEELSEILIEKGEGRIIEFKPSLQSYKNEKEGQVYFSRFSRFEIIRTIAAFLNSKDGGFLLVGVKDDKEILGLKNDFSLSGDKDPKDYFNIQIDYIIKQNFKPVASNITGRFVQIDSKDIYLFKVRPSSRPIFIVNNTEGDKAKHQKEFYVRTTGASSIHYYDVEDIVNYCLNHWNESKKK